jgi:pseudouridine-5'-phosphate glycosidase/pseudouridine kinase
LSRNFETQTGTLIGVPIPEAFEQKSIVIQKAVEQAVEESQRNGIAKRGKEVTPWILAKVKELTGGESVESSKFDALVVSDIC